MDPCRRCPTLVENPYRRPLGRAGGLGSPKLVREMLRSYLVSSLLPTALLCSTVHLGAVVQQHSNNLVASIAGHVASWELEYRQKDVSQEHSAACTPMPMLDPGGWVVAGWAEVGLGMDWAALEGLESRL